MCLTVGRQSRDLRPLSRDRSATFFKKFSNCLKRPKNVVWQSADGRVTSDHCRVTVQRLFSKKFLIAWNVQKTLFDSRPTVAWPPTTVAWPFSDFFQKIFPNCLKRPKNVVWQSADGRVTSDHCRAWPFWQSADFSRSTVQRLFSSKNVVWQRPTVAWPPTTVAWPFRPLSRDRSATFFKIFQIAWNVKKRCLTVGRRSRDLRPLSRDRSATFFKIFLIAWNVQKTLFDSRPTVAWPPTTVAWPFSDFFQNFPKSLETSKKRCLTVGRRSRDLRPLSRDRSATFFKIFPNCLKRLKNVVWQSAVGRVTSDHSRTTSANAHHILPRRCISRYYYFFFFFFFPPKAWPRISSYRNGPILEISTSYQS